jgi:serine/threonine-protein kinase
MGPDPLIGKQLLHYRVDEVIGQGGMSVVYRGHDENLKRDVAIKVLHPFLAEKAECRARLAREARAVARLEHPHILKVFDFSGDPDTIEERPSPDGKLSRVRGFAEGFIIAELVRGSTLKKFVEQHELWRCPEVGAMVLWQIALALQHAHQNGVVHRDLKPENVMVREDGWLKLMDFGIAQIADQKGLTITGTLLGSPAHMAPECIDGHPADERSDLFSLGTVLYWIATGSLPFEALTPHALLKQIVEGRAMPAQQRSPKISDDLARVIAKSMATKPADRYENAAALVKALDDVLEKSGLPADTQKLRAILASPDELLATATSAVRETFLRRAEAALSESQPARALACLNRVLAEDKNDAAARALLEKVQEESGAIEENTDDDKPVPALMDDATATTGVGLARLSETQPPSTNVGRLFRQAAVIVLAAGTIAAAFALAAHFDEKRSDEAQPSTTAPQPPSTAIPSTMPANDVDTSNMELGTPEAPKHQTKEPHKEKPIATATVRPVTTTTSATTPKDVDGAKQKVSYRVTPWADVTVDGSPAAAKDALKRVYDLELARGHHKIEFVNPGASTVTKEIDVGEVPFPVIAIDMVALLAQLEVQCDVPGAMVSVKDSLPVPAADTHDHPLQVKVNGTETVTVDVFKGDQVRPVEVKLVAGKPAFIHVTSLQAEH